MRASSLDKRKVSLLIGCVLVASVVVGCGANEVSNPRFKAGRQALMQGRYEPAIAKLQAYLQDNSGGRLASRASFLMAKAYLGLGKHKQSRQQFELMIREYPNSEEAHKSRYKLAMLSLLEGKQADARERFAQLTENPSGTLVPEATAMLRYLDEQELDNDGEEE